MISEFDHSPYIGLEMFLARGQCAMFFFSDQELKNRHKSVQSYAKICSWQVCSSTSSRSSKSHLTFRRNLFFYLIQCFNHVAIQKAHHPGKEQKGSTESVTKSDILGKGCGQK